MNKTLQWTLGISVIIIALALAVSLVAPIFNPDLAWGRGMMGPGHMGGMMGFSLPFMGWGMLVWPLLFVGLIVLGVLAVMNAARLQTVLCAHCGKSIQPGWKACPHCGEKV